MLLMTLLLTAFSSVIAIVGVAYGIDWHRRRPFVSGALVLSVLVFASVDVIVVFY